MIDTIDVFTSDKLAKEAIRESIPKDKLSYSDINSFYGSIENMQVKGNINGVSITGSIAKFLNKENVTPLSRESYKQALQELENTIGYDFLNDCIVRRVDVGYSFIVHNPVMTYLQLFGFYHNAKYVRGKFETNNGIETLSYQTGGGSFAFCVYDKIKECSDKGVEIPELYKDLNVLRMEYRILERRGIQRAFGTDINPYQIAEKGIYRQFVELFSEFYFNIHKSGRVFCVKGIKDNSLTTKAFFDLWNDISMQDYQSRYEIFKQLMIDNGKLKQSCDTLKDIRKREKSCRENFLYADTNDLIQELDEKVRLQVVQGK